jgi:hypothetical protein
MNALGVSYVYGINHTGFRSDSFSTALNAPIEYQPASPLLRSRDKIVIVPVETNAGVEKRATASLNQERDKSSTARFSYDDPKIV